MPGLTREALLNAAAAVKFPQETVELPALGGNVVVRGMSAAERDTFEAGMVDDRGDRRSNLANFRGRLLVRCLFDEGGQRLLTDDEAHVIGGLPAMAVQPAFDVAMRLNALRKEDVEELAEGFTEIPGDDSVSD